MDSTRRVVGTGRWKRAGSVLGFAVLLLAPGLGAAVTGRVTECFGTQSVPGYVVKVFEEVRIGFPHLIFACRITTQPERLLGTATTDGSGRYSINVTPTARDPDACEFEANLFVRIFLPDGTTLVGTSSEVTSNATVDLGRFDLGASGCVQLLGEPALTIDPPSIIAGGASATGRLTISVPGGSRPQPTTFTLFASDEDGLVMQDTLVLPGGQNAIEFPIASEGSASKAVTVFAASNETGVLSADLAISPNGHRLGFINDDDRRDISDAVFLLSFLFVGGEAPRFPAFADVNGSGLADLSDAVALLSFLFADFKVSALCASDPATLATRLQLEEQVVTDGEEVTMLGNFPVAVYRILLKGFSFPNGRLVSGSQVVGERRLVYCTCLPAVRSEGQGLDGEKVFEVRFNVPLDAPSGEYEVYLLPAGPSCPAGNAAGTGCLEDACALGPMKLFVQPSHILSLIEELNINNNSEPNGDHPAELFFTFASQTGEPDSTGTFPVTFSDSYPGGRVGSQHLTEMDGTVFRAEIPIFIGRETEMERTECEEECASTPDPARCRTTCAEAARRMNNILTASVGGVEFDCLDDCSSIWDEVANLGTIALGCLVGAKTGNIQAGCAAGTTLGGIFEKQLEGALEDEDDTLGTVDFNFTRGTAPFWAVGATAPPGGLSGADIDIVVTNHRLPAFRVVEAKLNFKTITLIEADDEDCFAPDEIFLEARASLGLNGRLGEAERLPETGNLSMAEGATVNISNLSLSAGTNADSAILYVEIGVWDDDGDDENELIGLHSRTIFLGDLLEARSVPRADFVVNGRERRRIRQNAAAEVFGWNSGERCDCTGIGACAFDPRIPHGRARVEYQVEVTWEKYPQP